MRHTGRCSLRRVSVTIGESQRIQGVYLNIIKLLLCKPQNERQSLVKGQYEELPRRM